MYISKERYDELISDTVGYQMFRDVLNDKEISAEEKIYQMNVILEVKEGKKNDNIRCN